MTLGEQIAEALRNIMELIINADEPEVILALAQQQRELSGQMQALIDREVPQATAEYEAATTALTAANTRLIEARQDAEQVVGGLELLAAAAERIRGLIDTLS
jgi:hypothetical protein